MSNIQFGLGVGFAVFVALWVTQLLIPDRTMTRGKHTFAYAVVTGFCVSLAIGGSAEVREPVMTLWYRITSVLDGWITPAFLIGYVVIGSAWALGYFWLYAKRLGQMYVLNRDAWLDERKLQTVRDLTEQDQSIFVQEVVEPIKADMLYTGDFPLRVSQQKRFFAANFLFWPITLAEYLFWDLLRDIGRQLVLRFSRYLSGWWALKMAEYEADSQLLARGSFR